MDLDVPFCLTTLPKEWLDYYHRNEYIHIDPVIGYGLSSIKPALFSDIPLSYAKSRELRSCAAERGIFKSGFVVPLRGPLVNRAMVCFSNLEKPEQWNSTIVSLQTKFIQLAHELHENVLAIGHFPQAEVALTARQKQCLKWASLGKTAAETAIIIGVTERAVRAHLTGARSVLNASNITQAVAKATALHAIF
ncbi:helix-turn-helix transcriptional regulator [Komagataeibacter diospyri]|uniref:helix-turn-helix transcriptional regulator n=1 Tax=Komagataeibacter diospyri TaxID=1932662 RepID=UPI00222028B2|nr:LuxR family transcriptional regulator [Komagataeibacter diospyri]